MAGDPISLADLRGALPKMATPMILQQRNDQVAFLPPPADGGLAAAAAFMILQNNPNDVGGAAARSLAAAVRWRQGGVDGNSVLHAPDLQVQSLPPLPASTSFVTMDKDGNAVACSVSMDNLFGTGRVLPGMGILLAASPAVSPAPLYAAAIAARNEQRPCLARGGGRLGPGWRRDGGGRRHDEHAAYEPADERAGARAWAGQRNRVLRLSAG